MEVALATGEGHAVIAHEKNQRILKACALLDDVQHRLKIPVRMFDFAHVFRQILADPWVGLAESPAREPLQGPAASAPSSTDDEDH
jgi:hypothetical protein